MGFGVGAAGFAFRHVGREGENQGITLWFLQVSVQGAALVGRMYCKDILL